MRDFFLEAVFLCTIPLERALSNFDINWAPSALASSNFFALKLKFNFFDKDFNSDFTFRFLKRLFLSWRILLNADFNIGNLHSPFKLNKNTISQEKCQHINH